MTQHLPSNGAGPVLDRRVIERIRALQRPGRPPVLARLIDMYLGTAPELISEIRSAIDLSDPGALRSAAHLLKSTSANLGVDAVAEVARSLESLARRETIDGARTLADDLDLELERAVGELLRERPQSEG